MASTALDRAQGLFLVSCDHCSKPLYRVSGLRLMGLENGPIIQPIALEVGSKLRVHFCGRVCAVSWMQEASDSDLLGGYPLGPF